MLKRLRVSEVIGNVEFPIKVTIPAVQEELRAAMDAALKKYMADIQAHIGDLVAGVLGEEDEGDGKAAA